MIYEALNDFTIRHDGKHYKVGAGELWSLAEEQGDEITLYKYNDRGRVDTITIQREYLVNLFKAV